MNVDSQVPSFLQYASKPELSSSHQQGVSNQPQGSSQQSFTEYDTQSIEDMGASEGIAIQCREEINVTMTGDGELNSGSTNTISGTVRLLCLDERAQTVKLKFKMEKNHSSSLVSWKKLLKTHPYIDKKLFQGKGVVQPKAKKKYPSKKKLDVVRWALTLNDETKEALPIEFTAWVDSEAGKCKVFLEYEVREGWKGEINNFLVVVPTHNGDIDFDDSNVSGNWNWNSRAGNVTWKVDTIDTADESENRHGTLEFHCVSKGVTEADLFPMEVRFITQW